MPNIRNQNVDVESIEIVASDGRRFNLSRLDLANRFAAETGTPSPRKQRTVDWVKAEMVAALGAEQVDAGVVDFDFRTSDGRPLRGLELKRRAAK